jgi:hypothetical protein
MAEQNAYLVPGEDMPLTIGFPLSHGKAIYYLSNLPLKSHTGIWVIRYYEIALISFSGFDG